MKFRPNKPQLVLASQVKREGSNEYLVGQNGELNANNKKDLFAAIAQLASLAQDNHVVTDKQAREMASTAQVHREMVLAAFDSQEELAALGDQLAETIQITANRDGFMRRFLMYQEVAQGQIPTVRVNTKNVTAAIATGPVQTQTQIVRDNTLYPAEFYITARPYIEQKDISRTNTDIVEEKYNEALEAIMVTEDRVWKRMADDLIGLDNPHLNISGAFTPQALAQLTSYVADWGIAPTYALIASNLWQDITADQSWQNVLDPISQNEVLLTGRLGTVHGMEIVSDHFRHANHRVLQGGEVYVIGAQDQHGQYTDRGGVEADPLNHTQERVPGRGWAMYEQMSMIIGNSRSVARGRRI